MVDDADRKVLEHPASSRIWDAVGAPGATASQYLLSQPLCGPSRATVLRGMYSHNTGVIGNRNVYNKFVGHVGEASNVAVWLHDAGYTTALVGKYLNGYQVSETELHVPPGWDYWFAVGHDAYQSYNYPANDNGSYAYYAGDDDPGNYLTTVLTGQALGFLDDLGVGEPCFLVITPMAPHTPAVPIDPYLPPLYEDEYYPTDNSVPANLSFNEDNVSDKPLYIAMLDKLGQNQIARVQALYRNRLRCMESNADLVQAVLAKLDDIDPGLSNTYVFFTSDNGYHMGEHRLGHDSLQDEALVPAPGGKNTMYEEDIRVPLWVRGPGIAAGTVMNELVGNVDLAPTFCDIAGVAWDPTIVDGRSILPLLHGQAVPWRTRYLITRGQLKDYAGIRATDWVFTELDDPAQSETAGEYYVLDPGAGVDYDPYELGNQYQYLDPADRATLHTQVAAYQACGGDSCRIADSL